MDRAFHERLSANIADLHEGGLYKAERVITSKQSSDITVATGGVSDGSHVLTSSTGDVLLWPIEPLADALATRSRDLTAEERARYMLP